MQQILYSIKTVYIAITKKNQHWCKHFVAKTENVTFCRLQNFCTEIDLLQMKCIICALINFMYIFFLRVISTCQFPFPFLFLMKTSKLVYI